MKMFIQKYNVYGLFLLFCVFYIYKAIAFPIHDSANYYFGAQFLIDGKFNPSIYFPYEFNKAIANLGCQNIFASYAPNTPFLALFFTPLTLCSVTTAKLIFNIISSFLLTFSCYRLFEFYQINRKYLLLIPFLFLVPIKNNLLFGQVYFLLFFLLTETLLSYEKQQFKKTGFFLSLAILLKIFPILFFAFFLFKKQLKPIFYTLISSILFFGISVIFTGIDSWIFFIQSVLPKASNGEIANAFVDNYQSVFMFLKRIFIYDEIENPHPFSVTSSFFSIVILAFKIGIIALGYFVTKNAKNNLHIFSFWILASILLSPYGSTYTFILMFFPLLALLKSEISLVKKIIAIGILFLINNLPLSLFIEKSFPFSYVRLFLLVGISLLFLFYFFKKSIIVKPIVLSALILILGSFYKSEKIETSKPFLSEDTPILIYDYTINNNQLTYFYWNEKGENKKTVTLKIDSWKELEIKNQQIFYNNNQLTFDRNNKLKPILINNKEIVFLSDENRGVGFYDIRILDFKNYFVKQ